MSFGRVKSKYTLRRWFLNQTIKNDYLMSSNQRFLMDVHNTYLRAIFICANCPRLVLRQRFLMMDGPLIFNCMTLCTNWLSRPLNQRFLMTYSPLIFVCVTVTRAQTWLIESLNQHFLMVYSPLIFYDFCIQNCPR